MKKDSKKSRRLALELDKYQDDAWKTAKVLFMMATETLAERRGLDRQTALMIMKYVAEALD
jgi:hypothetical protein